MTDKKYNSQVDLYLPRLVLGWGEENDSQRYREIEGTLVHVDISGFTAMSERLARKGLVGSEEVAAVLNATFTELLTVANTDGGDLLKFGGDALLLLFQESNHAARACRAAYGMRQALRTVGNIQTSAGRVKLRMSVGVHSGIFDLLMVGSSHRELIVAGPAASQTIVMEEAAEAGEIMVSHSTASGLTAADLGAPRGSGQLLRRAPSVDGDASPPIAAHHADEIDGFVPVALRPVLRAASPTGEHRRVTIGFVKYLGADRIIEQEGLVEFADRIDELVNITQQAADAYEVTFLSSDIDVDGGKLILVSGAPDAHSNDEERMLRAVRRIVDSQPRLTIKIGVNRGHVFAGDVGAPFRRTYTIIGDAVNLSARVMARAAQGQILVTPKVLEHSATTFETETVEPFHVKGKTEPIEAETVGAITGVKHRGLRRLPLTGREAEAQILTDGLQSARANRGTIVEISGIAGIGKSRLLEELHEASSDLTSLRASCERYEASTPYFPFRNLLRQVAGIDEDADHQAAGVQLQDLIKRRAPFLLPWVPLLAVPMDVEVAETPESTDLSSKFRRRRTHQAVRDFMRSILSSPTVTTIEDVQWMDDASADLLRELVGSVAETPWLICVTRQPEAGGYQREAGDPGETIDLQPLDSEAAYRLALAATEDSPMLQHRLKSLIEQSGGNPLFLLELLDHTEGTEDLPDSVEALVSARIDRLDLELRRLLRYSAVVGVTFDQELVAETAGDEVPEARQPTSWDRLSEFIEQDDGQLRFRHSLYRDVAYEGLPFRLRRQLHERIGSVIETRSGDHPEEQAELLSLHYLRGENFNKAWHYATLAGDEARGSYANVEAAEFFRRAQVAGRRLPEIPASEYARVCEALGDVLELAGLYDDADRALRDARRSVPEDPIWQARLMGKQGLLRERKGSLSHALQWFSRGLSLLEEEADRNARADLFINYAGVRFRQGRFAACIKWCERALEQLEGSSNTKSKAHALHLLVTAYAHLNNPTSESAGEQALAMYEQLGDLVGQANVLNNLGVRAYYQGKWDLALDYWTRGREAREKAGDVVGAATQVNNLGEIYSDQGRYDEAAEMFRTALRVWRSAHFPVGIALATSNLGRLAARSGNHEEAGDTLREAIDLFEQQGAESFIAETMTRLAENYVLAGDSQRGLDTIKATLDRLSGGEAAQVLMPAIRRVRAYALAQQQRWDEAIADLTEAVRQASEAHGDYEHALALDALCRVTTVSGIETPDNCAADAHRIFAQLDVVAIPEVPLPVVAAG